MYIKMLEKEVLRLRESEREAIERAQSLQQQLDRLVHDRGQKSISSPTVSDEHFDEQNSYGHVTSLIEGARGVYVNVEFPEGSGIVSPATTSASTGTYHPLGSDIEIPATPQRFHAVPETAPTPSSPKTLLADPRHGIKFVLG